MPGLAWRAGPSQACASPTSLLSAPAAMLQKRARRPCWAASRSRAAQWPRLGQRTACGEIQAVRGACALSIACTATDVQHITTALLLPAAGCTFQPRVAVCGGDALPVCERLFPSVHASIAADPHTTADLVVVHGTLQLPPAAEWVSAEDSTSPAGLTVKQLMAGAAACAHAPASADEPHASAAPDETPEASPAGVVLTRDADGWVTVHRRLVADAAPPTAAAAVAPAPVGATVSAAAGNAHVSTSAPERPQASVAAQL